MFSTYRVICWIDGGCRNNGTPDASGYASVRIRGRRKEDLLLTMDLSHAHTNNEAELGALLCALDLVSELKELARKRPVELEIRSDSRNLIGWVSGDFKLKTKRLLPLRDAAVMGISEFRQAGAKLTLTWVPREEIVAKVGH